MEAWLDMLAASVGEMGELGSEGDGDGDAEGAFGGVSRVDGP